MAVGTRAAWIADVRSDDELIATAMIENQLPEEEEDGSSGAFDVLLWRSGPDLLERAIALAGSAEWMERELGVDLLGHIRDPAFRDADEAEVWTTGELLVGYLEETMGVLLALVETETYPDVVNSLAWAFGAREDPRGIEPLTRLAADEAVHIREAVVHSLSNCSVSVGEESSSDEVAAAHAVAEQIAIPLLALADDPEGDVRDWALFGLLVGELDTAEIRETFLAHIDDPHHAAMTEALSGLANLGDQRGIEPLRRRIERGEDANNLIEACEFYGDARLVPGLQALRDDDFDGDDAQIDAALATCRPNLGWRGPSLGWWQPAASRR